MSERIKMTVEFDVTEPQALALQAMFERWNRLAGIGSSRMVAFYVDGDGNFKPNVTWKYSQPIRELTDHMREVALGDSDPDAPKYDFDPIAWACRFQDEQRKAQAVTATGRQVLADLITKVADSYNPQPHGEQQ